MTSDFHWDTTFLGLRKLSSNDMFVDFTGPAPIPFVSGQIVPNLQDPTQVMARSNMSFLQFTPMDVSKYFDVDPDSIAQCKLSDQCSSTASTSSSAASSLTGLHQAMVRIASGTGVSGLLAKGEDAREVSIDKTAVFSDATPPTVPDSYTVDLDYLQLETEGLVAEKGGSFCCTQASPGECQVVMQHAKGRVYHDKVHERARHEDVLSGVTRVDFIHDPTHPAVSMVVDNVGGVDTCVEWCPLDPSDRLAPFAPWTQRKGPFLDLGSTQLGGVTVEHYQWKWGLVALQTDEIFDFYATISSSPSAGGNVTAMPVLLSSKVQLLGRPSATINTTYGNFSAGVPPAAKFQIAKGPNDGCPQSSKCGDTSWQAHRLAMRQYATHAMYNY